ncbi:MAG TPA: type IV pilus assembly protein PilM [Acidimicrobiales bacterium]|nr:type IV pilus assembly protein PilM [Acidimicrobiales bacterium]
MSQRVVGLDIGTSAVRAVELLVGGDKPLLLAFGQVTLPRDAVVSGEITQPTVVAEAIRRLWKEGGFKQTSVATSVAGLRVIARQLEMPAVSDAEVESAIRFQAADLIPFPTEQAAISAQVLGDFQDAEGTAMSRVLVGAAHKEVIDGAVTAITLAGLTPVNIDLSSAAVARALMAPDSEATEAYVEIGAGMTMLVVHDAGKPRFVRTIQEAGNSATDAIAAVMNLPFIDAEVVKRKIGSDDPQAQEARMAVRTTISDLAAEVRRSIDFYRGMGDQPEITRLLVTGGGSRLQGIVSELERQTGLPTIPAPVLSRIDTSKVELGEEELAQIEPVLATPIGIALPGAAGTRRFNLLPAEFSTTLANRALRKKMVVAGAVAVGLMAVAYGARFTQVHSEQDQVKTAQGQVDALQAKVNSYASFLREKTMVKNTDQVLSGLVAHEISWPAVIDQVGREIPPGVAISSFSGQGATTTSASAAAGGVASAPVLGTISMSVTGPAYTSVAQWVSQMQSSPAFSNVFATGLSKSTGSVTFSSTASVTSSATTNRAHTFEGSQQ